MPRLQERAKSLVSQLIGAREAISEATVEEAIDKETVEKETVEKETVEKEMVEKGTVEKETVEKETVEVEIAGKETATDENRIEEEDLPDPCEPPKQTNQVVVAARRSRKQSNVYHEESQSKRVKRIPAKYLQ